MEDILQNTVLFHMPQVDGILKTGIIKVIVFPVSADLVRYEIGDDQPFALVEQGIFLPDFFFAVRGCIYTFDKFGSTRFIRDDKFVQIHIVSSLSSDRLYSHIHIFQGQGSR